MRKQIIEQCVGSLHTYVHKYDYYFEGQKELEIRGVKQVFALKNGIILYKQNNILKSIDSDIKIPSVHFTVKHISLLSDGRLIFFSNKSFYITEEVPLSKSFVEVDVLSNDQIITISYNILSGTEQVYVWNLDGECLFSHYINRNINGLQRILPLNDGSALIALAYGDIIRVSSKGILMTLEGHTNYIVDISIYGDRIVTSSEDKTIKMWDLTCHTTINEYAYKLIITHDEIITVGTETLKKWNFNGHCIIQYDDSIIDIKLLPNNSLLTISVDGSMRIYQKIYNTDLVRSTRFIKCNKIITYNNNTLTVWK